MKRDAGESLIRGRTSSPTRPRNRGTSGCIKDIERNRNRREGKGWEGEGELLQWATLPKTREVGESLIRGRAPSPTRPENRGKERDTKRKGWAAGPRARTGPRCRRPERWERAWFGGGRLHQPDLGTEDREWYQRCREKQKQKKRDGERRGGRAVALGHVAEDEGGGRAWFGGERPYQQDLQAEEQGGGGVKKERKKDEEGCGRELDPGSNAFTSQTWEQRNYGGVTPCGGAWVRAKQSWCSWPRVGLAYTHI